MAALQDTESINELLGDSSRKGIDMVVQLVGDNPVLFKQFLEITLRKREHFRKGLQGWLILLH